MPRPPRPLSDPDHPKRRILAAAADEFAEKGFAQAMVEDIAQASGLSKAAIYRYYPSKHALIVAVAEDYIDLAVRTLEEIEARELPPAEALVALVAAHVERLLTKRAAGRVMLRQLPAGLPGGDHIERQRVRYWRGMHAIIKFGIGDGTFVPVPTWLATEAMIGMASSVSDRFSPSWPLPPKAMASHYAYLAVSSLLMPGAAQERAAALVASERND